MSPTPSHMSPTRLACVFAGLMAVSGCDRDDAGALKERVNRWVSVGANSYFESQYGCTAAVFELRDLGFKAAIARVNNISDGLRALSLGRPVAFDTPDLSPTQVSEHISSSNLPEGMGLIGAGVSAADCMSDEVKQGYINALNAKGAVMIFDTTDNAVAIADFAGKSLYFAGGRN